MHKATYVKLEELRKRKRDEALRDLANAQEQLADLEHKQRNVAAALSQPLQGRYSADQFRAQASWRQQLSSLAQQGQLALEQAYRELEARRARVLEANIAHRQVERMLQLVEAREARLQARQEQKACDDIAQRRLGQHVFQD